MRKHKTTRVLMLGALIATGLGTAAMAERGGHHGRMPWFDFGAVDTDKDGKITQAEMDAFRAARLAEADTNTDGKVSVDELMAQRIKRATERAAQDVPKMFAALDKNSDGFLSADEMTNPRRMAKMFGRMDNDNDGAISQAEADAARADMAGHRGKHGCGGPDQED